jgi:hypothetical protein
MAPGTSRDKQTNLSRTNLSDANLDGAYLSDAYLSDANLDGAYPTQAQLDAACGEPPKLAAGDGLRWDAERTFGLVARNLGDFCDHAARWHVAPFATEPRGLL